MAGTIEAAATVKTREWKGWIGAVAQRKVYAAVLAFLHDGQAADRKRSQQFDRLRQDSYHRV